MSYCPLQEDLLELTMNDSTDGSRKSKKHKKQKKSKKSAITLDEFLNMNNVFGEGMDFQGIEEVPTQVIAKRFKTKKQVPASKFMSSDLVKLKRQGIVVKKQPTKIGKPLLGNNVAIKAAINSQKKLNPTPQKVSKALTSTDAVLSKLLNQGSQIKIVKKSNQDSEEPIQQKEETPSSEGTEEKNEESNALTDVMEMETENVETSKENISTEIPEISNENFKSLAPSPNPESPSLIGDNNYLTALQSHDEDSNNSAKSINDKAENPDLSEQATKLTHNLTTLQNNKNIILKLPKQNSSTKEDNINTYEKPTKLIGNLASLQNNSNITLKSPKQSASEDYLDNQETNSVETTKIKEISTQENTDKNNSASLSEKSSLNALKHLSHLITIKSVNSNKALPMSDNKPENNLQKTETTKALPNLQNSSSQKSEINRFSNFKRLDGITIKPTNKLNTDTSKNHQSMESKDNFNENNETDEEWHDDKTKENKIDAELAPVVKSTQLNVQTKHSPKTIQKESPKGVLNNDHNSQSSADLLKHLKNVTAKPVNANSQKIQTSVSVLQVSSPLCSPSAVKKITPGKTSVQKEISEDGTEIFSIDDSDSDEEHCATSNTVIKTENKIETNKSVIALKNINKNITTKLTNQQCRNLKNMNADKLSNKATNEDSDWDDECDDKEHSVIEPNTKFSTHKPNQKNIAINNVLKNLSRNITVRSRNSSPSLSVQSQEHNSRDHLDTNEADSDSDTPLSRVKITEMDNMSDDELLEDHVESDNVEDNVKVEHPDDSHSDRDDEPVNEELDDMADIESQIATTKLQKNNTRPNSNLNTIKNLSTNTTIKSANRKTVDTSNTQGNSPTDEIPSFAKNLSNQISIKQIKKAENENTEDAPPRPMNQSVGNKKIATSSNQLNTFNKEVKTIKTFQTQTNTVIQEITTTVTKTIKTVNQTTKQEVRDMAQSSSGSLITQNIQGLNTSLGQKNYQGMKVRQSAPCVRPRVRGQAPQTVRPAITTQPQFLRPALGAIARPNQLVPVRAALNRPSGPRPRMPNVMNMRPSTSGQQRPQMMRPVKVSPRAVFPPPKKPAETPGHFSCFKKPKESLIPEPDFLTINKTDEDSSVQFSSTMQMSKSNFCSTSKTVKGNSVVTSTQTKSEMSASSQQLSKLRGMSGLVVKTSQSQAKQTQVEEKNEMSASKRNALEAIQKLQSKGLLVKKPRIDVSEENDRSPHGSDDMGHCSSEEFDA